MGDIGERSAMHKGRVVFQRLHEIGLHCVLQQDRHCAIGLDIAAVDRGFVTAIGHDDIAKPLFKIVKIQLPGRGSP